jgi:N-acetylneuraminic acid mutarotase
MKKLLLGCWLLLAAGITVTWSQGTWTQKANFGGMAREDAVGFSIADKGYIGTGISEDGEVSDFWEYDPTADAWTQKADFGGGPRSSAVGFAINNKGYLGTGSFANDFWEYDPALNVWTKKADFAGTGRFGAIGFSIGSKGYLGTGFSFEDWYGESDFWEYDPATDFWTKKASFGGGGRYNAIAFSIGEKGYAGTGFYYSVTKQDFWEYDPATDTWSGKAALDYRHEAIGFCIGGKGYCGLGYDQEGINELNDFNEYDPVADSWTEKANYEGAGRVCAVGFSIGEKGYVGTGIDNVDWMPQQDFWEYTPETVSTCMPPAGLVAPIIRSTSAKISWDAASGAQGYMIRYKMIGATEWLLKTATLNSKKLEGLTPQSDYVWQVRTYCSVTPPTVTSEWSEKQYFTTTALRLGDEEVSTFKLHPNPTNGHFTLALTLGDVMNAPAIIQVINSLGQIVYAEKVSVASGMLLKEIQVNSLPAGVYLVKVIVNDQVYSASINYQK